MGLNPGGALLILCGGVLFIRDIFILNKIWALDKIFW
jgi:hypothetical protein